LAILKATNNPLVSTLEEYLKATTETKAEIKISTELEEIEEVLQAQLQKLELKNLSKETPQDSAQDSEKQVLTERLVDILSLCSLVKFKKQILAIPEILDSSISTIYNHIIFWCKEDISLDLAVINKIIAVFKSKYSTPSEYSLS